MSKSWIKFNSVMLLVDFVAALTRDEKTIFTIFAWNIGMLIVTIGFGIIEERADKRKNERESKN